LACAAPAQHAERSVAHPVKLPRAARLHPDNYRHVVALIQVFAISVTSL
jgi:hypothetical protein